MSEYTVAKASDIPPGAAKQVEVDGDPIALFNVDGKFHAISDLCSHAHAYLSEGTLDGTIITCPLHGATFDVTTGKNLSMPAVVPVRKYEVKIEGDEIKIVV